MQESLVLYPAPGFHHMVSMVEFGKLILRHHPYFKVTILVTTMPSDTATTSLYIDTISQINVPISFFTLPSIDLPQSIAQSRTEAAVELIRLNSANVVDALGALSLTSTVVALITSAFHVAYHPHIPTYYYFTSCASALAVILYLPTIHDQTSKSFKDLDDTLLHFPGLPPLKASEMPDALRDRDDPAYRYFLDVASRLPRLKGVIVNTFDSLEPHVIKAIIDGACVVSETTPPIYRVGPFIVDAKDRAVGFREVSFDCLAWLDSQPQRSVVFLCFGRRGSFSELQLKEMAIGLEKSNHRFLWVVKSPLNSNTEPDLEVLLPEGFLERTKDRGVVVKSWAPQSAILSHESIGGFVTHCGWNSVLEAVTCGVPMAAWPLYAEQRMNSVVLVEDMKLATPIEKVSSSSISEELVSAEELEKRVRLLMDSESEEGKGLRERSLAVKAMAMEAWTSGGSSCASFSKLVASWKQGY
ncbi:UDP-glucuronosyl/UDP-glucosyltransferase [Trema orientale]|uniref:Glycosyltransferase n=1 Tax=Trema orientale TaxID=63057 RepID=A0A2P5EEM1_TREOI|nr:UDP-glucuronosyl/UDP-glucosyltransferase [Trema orientale]